MRRDDVRPAIPALLHAGGIEAIFAEGSGTQWDAKIVQCFFACRHELYAVYQRGLGQSVYMAVERAAGGGSQVLRAPLAVALSADA